MESKGFISKSSFSKKKVIKPLTIKLEKKTISNFSKSQPMRRSLFSKGKQFRILNMPIKMLGTPGVVLRVEYDPYRTSAIVLVWFRNQICSYYRKVHNVTVGSTILSSLRFYCLEDYKRGNASTISLLPPGLSINQISSSKNSLPKYSTSAGTYSTLLRKSIPLGKAFVRLPSGFIKQIAIYSFAVIGAIGTPKHSDKVLYKAGQNRWLGKRPIVRGVAKNPFDHPHGGGEGKKSQNMFPKTFWGKKLKWRKTSRTYNL